jgi:hypothetical protein
MSVLSIIKRDDNWAVKKLNDILTTRGSKKIIFDRFMLGQDIDYNDFFDIKMLLKLTCDCLLDKYKGQVYTKINSL